MRLPLESGRGAARLSFRQAGCGCDEPDDNDAASHTGTGPALTHCGPQTKPAGNVAAPQRDPAAEGHPEIRARSAPLAG